MIDAGRVGEGMWPHLEQICSDQPPVPLLPGGGLKGGREDALLLEGQKAAGEHAWGIIHKNFPQHCQLLGVSSYNFLHPQIRHSQGQGQGQGQGINASERREVEQVSTYPFSPLGVVNLLVRTQAPGAANPGP